MRNATINKVHIFEAAGLGQAPFRLVGMTEKVYRAADGTTFPGGTCAFCGTGIRYAFEVSGADGSKFVVGSDCITRINDTTLVNQLKRLKRQQKEAKRVQEFEDALQAQRERNGGLTDREVEDAKWKQAQEARAAAIKPAVESMAEVIDALMACKSDFGSSVAYDLKRGYFPRGRGWDIACEIYAKHIAGRRGTIAYDAALQDASYIMASAQKKIHEIESQIPLDKE
jgi:hypothetical protein